MIEQMVQMFYIFQWLDWLYGPRMGYVRYLRYFTLYPYGAPYGGITLFTVHTRF